VVDESVEVARGQLAFGPTSRGWRGRDGKTCLFHDLFISASERFSGRAMGTAITLERADS